MATHSHHGDFLRTKGRERERGGGAAYNWVTRNNDRYHLSPDAPAPCRRLTSKVFMNGTKKKPNGVGRKPFNSSALAVVDRYEVTGATLFSSVLYSTPAAICTGKHERNYASSSASSFISSNSRKSLGETI